MSDIRRFACTQCGMCCNRAPEVELSEAAALADVFAFRLMFRLYSQPRTYMRDTAEPADAFYEKKRLLTLHAARKYPAKLMRGGKRIDATNYLMVSALALDVHPGSCPARKAGICTIHERRPLTCQSVPLHYSRGETLAVSDFDSFVRSEGYGCDTSDSAPPFIVDGRIVDAAIVKSRAVAASVAEGDRLWKEAIIRRVRAGDGADGWLPTIGQIERNASVGPLTTSMKVGWEIAVEAGLISWTAYGSSASKQLQLIDRVLESGGCGSSDRDTLIEMRTDYAAACARFDDVVGADSSARRHA